MKIEKLASDGSEIIFSFSRSSPDNVGRTGEERNVD